MALWFAAQPITNWNPISCGGGTAPAFAASKLPVLKSHESLANVPTPDSSPGRFKAGICAFSKCVLNHGVHGSL
jgi:hypothetical protein